MHLKCTFSFWNFQCERTTHTIYRTKRHRIVHKYAIWDTPKHSELLMRFQLTVTCLVCVHCVFQFCLWPSFPELSWLVHSFPPVFNNYLVCLRSFKPRVLLSSFVLYYICFMLVVLHFLSFSCGFIKRLLFEVLCHCVLLNAPTLLHWLPPWIIYLLLTN